MENKKISIIIAMRNEENYIGHCIKSILNSDYDNRDMEILIIDSMSNDNSKIIVDEYILKNENIKYYKNTKVYTPFAFNIGIKYAKGEYIFIVSAHCMYEKDYFSTLVKFAVELDADAVGAVAKTGVMKVSYKSCSIKNVLSHKFGVGNSYFRTGVDKITEVDAISGCYHRRVFERYGFYNEKLIRNQDIELNKRIKNHGGKLYLIPFTSYTYFVREEFRTLASNNYANGYWNILTAFYTKTVNSLSIRHFIPLVFVLSLFLPLCLSVFYSKILWISILSLVSYLALVIIISIRLKNDSNSIIHLISSFLTLHFSYGWGSLMGVFMVIIKYLKGEK